MDRLREHLGTCFPLNTCTYKNKISNTITGIINQECSGLPCISPQYRILVGIHLVNSSMSCNHRKEDIFHITTSMSRMQCRYKTNVTYTYWCYQQQQVPDIHVLSADKAFSTEFACMQEQTESNSFDVATANHLLQALGDYEWIMIHACARDVYMIVNILISNYDQQFSFWQCFKAPL